MLILLECDHIVSLSVTVLTQRITTSLCFIISPAPYTLNLIHSNGESKSGDKKKRNNLRCRAVIDNSNPEDSVFIPSDLYLNLCPLK